MQFKVQPRTWKEEKKRKIDLKFKPYRKVAQSHQKYPSNATVRAIFLFPHLSAEVQKGSITDDILTRIIISDCRHSYK